MATNFVLLTDEELEGLLDCDASNTKKVIRYSLKKLEEFAKLVGYESIDVVNSLTVVELDKFLCRFYAGLGKDDGTLYTKKSMQSIKYGISKHFISRGVDTTCSESFPESQQCFKAMMKKLKQEGKGCVKHKNPISREDMKKIAESGQLDIDTPLGLQNKVFMDVMVYFGQRGRESLRDMKPDDYVFNTDELGNRYFERRDTFTKSRRENENEEFGGRMYELKGSRKCPVNSLVKYKELLNPSCTAFWQRPKSKPTEVGPWYDNAPLGINTIGSKMNKIAVGAGWITKYTNHSLRATTVTSLNDAGFESRDIMTVTGHKAESSLKHYAKTSALRKREMSANIAKGLAEGGNENENAGPGDVVSHAGTVVSAVFDLQKVQNQIEGAVDADGEGHLTLSQELIQSNINIQSSSSSTTKIGKNTVQHFHFNGPVTFINKT
ncbi:uncharacterized protein KIAA1958 homolog [Diadema antillarum]|uniref:uncharacterized protein KIAA1958 homolog n=1 Tax=Diadema antillarum TaxID=105358 RepID=UPI003A855F6D